MICSILVVEDSATQAEALRSLLVGEGYEADVAPSAEAALERLAGTRYDLILSDIVMPGMSGFDLCRRVKSDPRVQDIPFLLLTSLSDPMDIVRGLECGADNYLTKPYDPEHLLARLRVVRDNRRLRESAKATVGVSVRFLGRELAITSEKEQILDLFISSVEDVVRANEALQASRAELARAHQQLAAFAQRKSHEARISTERYRTLLQNASDAIFVLDRGGTILELNHQAVALIGASEEPTVGTAISQLIAAEERGEFTAAFTSLPRDSKVHLGVHTLFRPDGPPTFIELSASLTPLDGEDLILLIARDVTERQRSAERLHEANQQLTTLIEASPLAIVVLDCDLRVELWNGAAERVFGWTAADVLGQANPLIEEKSTDGPGALDGLLSGSEAIRGLELSMRRRDGDPIEVSVYAVPLYGTTGESTGVLMVMADITERREAEKALQLKAQAEDANRAKSEFLSRMSHELRTPLNAILGFAQLLDLDELDADQRESVGQILRGGRHLLDLINEVLDLSRIEAGRLALSLEPVSLQVAATQAVSLIAPLAAERSLSIMVDEIDPELYVAADIQRLRQVLLNLLSNAVKYGAAGGSVRIFVADAGEGWVRLGVRDTGSGISQAQVGRLFSPFERLNHTDSEIQGTGLGLVLSRALMEAMGGRIGVESVVDEGSTFWIELPRENSPLLHTDVPAPPPPPPVAAGSSRTVLYIEDNPSNLRLVERVLASRSHIRLITAMQGSLGLELAQKHRPDLILLDVNLPDMVGEEVYRRLRTNPDLRDIPLVVVSADAIPAQVERFRRLGAHQYMTKPFDVEHLRSVVDECLRRDPN
jgi:PAS domain S-box-containing protein